jgi:hypothetical protein
MTDRSQRSRNRHGPDKPGHDGLEGDAVGESVFLSASIKGGGSCRRYPDTGRCDLWKPTMPPQMLFLQVTLVKPTRRKISDNSSGV